MLGVPGNAHARPSHRGSEPSTRLQFGLAFVQRRCESSSVSSSFRCTPSCPRTIPRTILFPPAWCRPHVQFIKPRRWQQDNTSPGAKQPQGSRSNVTALALASGRVLRLASAPRTHSRRPGTQDGPQCTRLRGFYPWGWSQIPREHCCFMDGVSV